MSTLSSKPVPDPSKGAELRRLVEEIDKDLRSNSLPIENVDKVIKTSERPNWDALRDRYDNIKLKSLQQPQEAVALIKRWLSAVEEWDDPDSVNDMPGFIDYRLASARKITPIQAISQEFVTLKSEVETLVNSVAGVADAKRAKLNNELEAATKAVADVQAKVDDLVKKKADEDKERKAKDEKDRDDANTELGGAAGQPKGDKAGAKAALKEGAVGAVGTIKKIIEGGKSETETQLAAARVDLQKAEDAKNSVLVKLRELEDSGWSKVPPSTAKIISDLDSLPPKLAILDEPLAEYVKQLEGYKPAFVAYLADSKTPEAQLAFKNAGHKAAEDAKRFQKWVDLLTKYSYK